MGHPMQEWRDEHDITQERLAVMAGLDRTTICKIEMGDRGASRAALAGLLVAMDVLRPGRALTAGQVLGFESYSSPEALVAGDGGGAAA